MIVLTPEQIGRLIAGDMVSIDGVDLMLKQDEHFASGAEIRQFYTLAWDDDYYYEPDNATIQIENEDGTWILKDDGLYDLRELGTLEWQGSNKPENDNKLARLDFEDIFLTWKKNRG